MATHVPVITNQVLHFLDPKPGEIFIDCTLGLGGHTEEILKKLQSKGAVYGIEVDERNLELARERLINYSNVNFIRDNFENLAQIGEKIAKTEKRIDGILFDLGLSSLHVDLPERGFSFQREGSLDMRYDTRQKLTAADIINTYSLKQLHNLFQEYGEEKFSYRIAEAIVEHRKFEPFKTTLQLANFIAAVVPKGGHFRQKRRKPSRGTFAKRIHPATRVFQALRIAANREIEALQSGLYGAVQALSPGGRLVVISYHSIEDRLVKNFFKAQKAQGSMAVLTKKPVRATQEEIETNKRGRSAKLRAARKV